MRCIETSYPALDQSPVTLFNLYMRCIETVIQEAFSNLVQILTYTWDVLKHWYNGC